VKEKMFVRLLIVVVRKISHAFFLLKAALAAKRARELVRTKSILKSSSLPGKLADCASTNPEESGESTFCTENLQLLGVRIPDGLEPLACTSRIYHLLIMYVKCRNLHS
jgi:hypothetical protein